MTKGVMCDAAGCIGKLGDGRLVILGIEAFAEDCTRAAIVVSGRVSPSSTCAATLVDREVWRAHGAVALRWTGDHFEQTVTQPSGYLRPWTRAAASVASGGTVSAQPASQDATPRSEALDPDD